ncbi:MULTISPECIES: cell division protein FtsB [Halomonas]|jgi:cell division protein FtsB|uniref:Cell division protein FtsB n=3 Tax=Halomonas TaxID=2745 RepID=A0AAU7KKC6_9GAMM|nr:MULTISPECIES: cell division protein FtsB [Halomonas]MBR9769946.1 cell division protein FtsB [Gammaproteobacteria bacterium]KJZ18088.1 cell division protein FtsB [Halomonas sp. S2151]MAR73897.1 cell division protein FtsB [Halomonas sp.]MAY73079.1 cell division protein FtsB [Halomonas sp.]MBR9878393.1 cell division protein FtsB [Gammaproteobacteria bacterium]|tara:strand:+ start:91 stop:426 length:336 start_codon:yes stop_codon:yes gene_type:complete
MLKTLAIVLLALLALLQYRLWLGQGGVMEMNEVSGRVAALEAENQPLRDRNARLSAEVVDLKTGLDAIEERARSDVGMVRTDEQFFWVPGVETDVAPVAQPTPGSAQGASE